MMRLRLVAEVDFRRSEATNWEELRLAKKIPTLRSDDVICLVNKARTQIIFVSPVGTTKGYRDRAVTVVFSRRLRIVGGGTWNPLMLANYAAELGIELEGLKRFEDHYRELKEVK